MMGKRRAVGEIIAAMVLLLVVSVGGGLLFSISMKEGNQQSSVLKEELTAESDLIQERFKIVNIDPTSDGRLSIWVLNYGEVDIIIDRIYVNDIEYGVGDFQAVLLNPLDSQIGSSYETSFELYVNDIKKFTFIDLTHADACGNQGKIVISSEKGVSIYGKCG